VQRSSAGGRSTARCWSADAAASFEALLGQDGDALIEEGERLVRFVGEGAEAFEVRFVEKT
jgi:hypothetical protein